MREVARLAPSPPFRLGAVALSHGWFQTAPFAWDPAARTLSRVEALPGGPAVLALREEGGEVAVLAGRRLPAADRAAALERVGRMLQAGHAVRGLHAAAGRVDPHLARDLRRLRAGRVLAGPSLWEDLVKAIAGTNIRWPQAVQCIARVAALGDDGAFPEPRHLLAAGEDRLREHARVGYRAPYLLAAARAALEGTLDALDRESAGLEAPELLARLRALAGVGPATARFLALLMGRYDLPAVDSAVIRHAAAGWFAGRDPSPAEIAARVERARPYSGLVLAWFVMVSWQREVGITA